MAEVLGTVSAVATLFDVAVRISKIIRDMRHCPVELTALQNEVSELRLLVHQIESLELEKSTFDTYLAPSLHATVKRLRSVQRFLQKIEKRPRLAQARWVCEKDHAQGLQVSLRDARQQIIAALSVLNIQFNLHLSTHLSTLRGQIVNEFTQARIFANELKKILLRNRQPRDRRQSPPRAESSTTWLESFQDNVQRSPLDTSWTQEHGLMPKFPDRGDDGALEIPVRASRSSLGRCSTGCPCSCHQRITTQVSNALFGSLILSYCGLSRAFGDCSISSCKTEAGSYDIRVDYTFPRWLLRKLISLSILFGRLYQPSMTIRIGNILPSNHEWFEAADIGAIDKLRTLLEACPSRINDVDEFGGTAAFLACRRDDYKCLSFLISQGADLGAGLQARSVVTILLSSRIIEQHGYLPCSLARSIFEETLWELPEPHRIVIESSLQDLTKHLSDVPTALNLKDDSGKTALWWAARLGKVSQLRKLLASGAAVNIRDHGGWSPITAACYWKGPGRLQAEMIEQLLSQKPDLTNVDVLNFNMLHRAVRVKDRMIQRELIVESIRQSANIHHRHNSGMTPLMYMVDDSDEESFESLNCFIYAGADINARDFVGANILMIAIRKKKPKTLSFFLQQGIDYRCIDKNGSTVLHWAAKYPHLHTLRALRVHGLAGVEACTRDHCGHTPLSIFEMEDHEQELQEEFFALVHKIPLEEHLKEA